MRWPASIGALAGFAGGELLLAFFANEPMLNFYGFVPVALGGMGNNRGAVIGGFALGLFQQAANFLVGGIFASVAVFTVFIIVLLARPEGLAGADHRAPRLMDDTAAGAPLRIAAWRDAVAALPFLALLLLGAVFPLFGGGYWGVIATRACVYWVLVSGLNLVVGFAGQIAIGWVALLTLGAYTTSVLVGRQRHAGVLALSGAGDRGVVGAVFGLIVGLPALRLRTFYFAMTTLGFATIVTQVALAWQSVTGGGVGVAGPVFPAPFTRNGASIISASAWPRSAPG